MAGSCWAKMFGQFHEFPEFMKDIQLINLNRGEAESKDYYPDFQRRIP